MKIYTRKGDDGTTALYGGGRVRKDDDAPEAYGTVDEAQAVLGMARSLAVPGGELDALLVAAGRVLMPWTRAGAGGVGAGGVEAATAAEASA